MAALPSGPVSNPDDPLNETSGLVRVDPSDPSVLLMTGEVDLAVAQRFRDKLGAGAEPQDVAAALPEVRTVDMRQVTFADSSALGLLGALILARQADPAAGPLVVLGTQPAVQAVLEISGMASFVDLRP